jgi:septum formation protein
VTAFQNPVAEKAKKFSGEPLVLASASPRRRTLLAEAGYEFRVEPADVSETAPAHLTVRETVLFNAKSKAEHVAHRHADSVVIGADTLVALEGRPFGKPRDLDEAFSMLSQLSGRTHEVFSGVWIVCRTRPLVRGFVETSQVRFRALSPDEIRAYMAQIQPLDKAGAYAAQEDATGIIAAIHGSRTNVIGLPMETLRRTLREFQR